MTSFNLHRFAMRFLCEYRTLSDDQPLYIPKENNALDKAMKIALNGGNFSEDITKNLSFANTNRGITCIELPYIITRGIDHFIIEPFRFDSNYYYLISPKAAYSLLKRYNQTNEMRDFVYKTLENLDLILQKTKNLEEFT